MIFHYAKKVIMVCLLLLPLSSCANSVVTHLTCTPKDSKVPLIAQLDMSLTMGSKEYFVHYQNNSSDWTFESYLFVGEVSGEYVIVSAGNELPKSSKVISKESFDKLYGSVMASTNDLESSLITSEQDYCQYIGVGEQRSVVLTEEASNSKLRKLRKKLDALIIYRDK